MTPGGDRDGGREHPFSNGCQFMDWEAANCGQCWKSTPSASRCAIESALYWGQIGDGTVSPRIAKRMGYLENRHAYVWECPEREAHRTVGSAGRGKVLPGQLVLL